MDNRFSYTREQLEESLPKTPHGWDDLGHLLTPVRLGTTIDNNRYDFEPTSTQNLSLEISELAAKSQKDLKSASMYGLVFGITLINVFTHMIPKDLEIAAYFTLFSVGYLALNNLVDLSRHQTKLSTTLDIKDKLKSDTAYLYGPLEEGEINFTVTP